MAAGFKAARPGESVFYPSQPYKGLYFTKAMRGNPRRATLALCHGVPSRQLRWNVGPSKDFSISRRLEPASQSHLRTRSVTSEGEGLDNSLCVCVPRIPCSRIQRSVSQHIQNFTPTELSSSLQQTL